MSIAQEYKDKYPNVFVVIDKNNGNYGSCINKGLEVATGKYVKVLDADDSFDTVNFEEFVSYLMQIDADLILSDFAIVNENRVVTDIKRYEFPVNRPLDFNTICCTDSFVDMYMHAVTYRREILNTMNYKQTEGISYTDQQWIFLPMVYVSTVSVFNCYVYKYMLGRIGQTMDNTVRARSINHMMRCLLDMLDGYSSHYANLCCYQVDYLKRRLIPQIKDVYILAFANYSLEMKTLLIEFDSNVKEKSETRYRSLENTKLKLNYIQIWRRCKNNINPSILRLAFRLMVALR